MFGWPDGFLRWHGKERHGQRCHEVRCCYTVVGGAREYMWKMGAIAKSRKGKIFHPGVAQYLLLGFTRG